MTIRYEPNNFLSVINDFLCYRKHASIKETETDIFYPTKIKTTFEI